MEQMKTLNMINLMISREKAIKSIEQRHQFLEDIDIEDIESLYNKQKSNVSIMIKELALALEEM